MPTIPAAMRKLGRLAGKTRLQAGSICAGCTAPAQRYGTSAVGDVHCD